VGQARLARRLTTIVPTMTLPEALETTSLHHVAGFRGWHGDNRVRLDIGEASSPAGSVHSRVLTVDDKPNSEMMSISVRRRNDLVNLWHLGALPGDSQ
jgi:hypothetical protein